MEAEVVIQAPEPSRRLRVSRYLFVFGLAFYIAVVWYLGWRKVGEQLLLANVPMLLFAASIIFTGNWLRALKWRYALGPGHNAIGIYFLSKVSAEWTPGRLGEFSPMVIRRHRTPKIGAWIMLDRLLEIIVTLVLGLAGLAIIRLFSWPMYWLLVGGAACSVFGVLFALTRRDFFLWSAKRVREDSWPHRFMMLFAAISKEIFQYTRRLPLCIAITVATKCSDLWAVCLVFLSFGYTVTFALAATAKCALAIVSFIPITPLATGLPHLTQAGLMNHVAGIPSEALAAAIGIEVVMVSVALWTSGGLAAAWERRRGDRAATH